MGEEHFGQGFGYGLRGDEVGWEAVFLEGAGGGGAYCGDFGECGFGFVLGSLCEQPTQGRRSRMSMGHPGSSAGEGFDGVGASEEQPVVGVEFVEGFVEGGPGGGRGQLYGGDEDGVGTEGAEMVGEFRALIRGAGDQDARFCRVGVARGHDFSIAGRRRCAPVRAEHLWRS